MALWDKGAIDPKTLLTILNFPDPQNTAAQAVLWRTNPQLYMQLNFPELAQQIQAAQLQGQGAGVAPPPGGATPPVANGNPPQAFGGVNANPSLSTVPLS